MKLALPALMTIFSSLAYGQTVEGNYLSPFPEHVRLVAKDFFKARLQKPTLNTWLNPEPVKYESKNWTKSNWETGRSQGEIFMPVFLSPEAVQVQLAVIKNNYRPIEGSFPKQIGHAFTEGLTNLAASDSAEIYYRQYGLFIEPGRAKAAFAYDHEPARLVLGPILNSIKRSAVAQAKYDLLRLVKRKR
jgi:hypothetical protein